MYALAREPQLNYKKAFIAQRIIGFLIDYLLIISLMIPLFILLAGNGISNNNNEYLEIPSSFEDTVNLLVYLSDSDMKYPFDGDLTIEERSRIKQALLKRYRGINPALHRMSDPAVLAQIRSIIDPRFETYDPEKAGYILYLLHTPLSVIDVIENPAQIGRFIGSTVINPELIFYLFIALAIYSFFFERKWNRTLGKFLTNTKIIQATSNSRVEWLTIFKRSLSRLIPLDPFSYCFSLRPSGWHDKISKTVVVTDRNCLYHPILSLNKGLLRLLTVFFAMVSIIAGIADIGEINNLWSGIGVLVGIPLGCFILCWLITSIVIAIINWVVIGFKQQS